jgi:glycosyltransferase involved in cell wall biosynthesis
LGLYFDFSIAVDSGQLLLCFARARKSMIWLASYPRSGNTFFRNVLLEVYGVRSSTFHHESEYPLDPEYASFPVVKTHLLPSQLQPDDPSIPAVYLVRDGRDCVVSLAHYRQQLIEPGSDFHHNLREAIDAEEGSHFGGWSCHVREWSSRAALILHFEDLIADPIACLEQLRPFLDLPEPNFQNVPSFTELRSKDFCYGSGSEHGFSSDERRRWREAKFRRGQAGGWRDELPHDLHLRFLHRHGGELEKSGYIAACPILGHARNEHVSATKTPASRVRGTVGTVVRVGRESARRRILIEGSKLLDRRIDGIHRYVRELLPAFRDAVAANEPTWEVDVSLGHLGTVPLDSVADDPSLRELTGPKFHPLLREGEGNPIHQIVERNAHRRKLGEKPCFRDQLSLRLHRFHRSILKRQAALQRMLQRSDRPYDLLHLTLPNTWQHFQHLDGSLLTTVHDLSHLICPETQTTSNVRTLARGLDFACRRDSHYLSVSQSTKDQMIDRLGIEENRIGVVYNAVCDHRFRPESFSHRLRDLRDAFQLDAEPFFLCLGTIEPRKNLLNTIRAFELLLEKYPALPVRLILAGGRGWQQHEELARIIASESRIRYIGYVDDADLPYLYSAAHALCYASIYEGFGLPVLEAMSCGTPVIYGDNSSMPEIAQGCGLPVEAHDPRSIQEAMFQLLTDEPLRRELSVQSILRATRFGWTETARRTLDLYRQAMDANERSSIDARARRNLSATPGYLHFGGWYRRGGSRDAA